MNGLLLIDKPAGITSHDVVDAIRRISGLRRVGHAGTLDPFATGLLILGLGTATKALGGISGDQYKEYEATLIFGVTSDTQDRTGTIQVTENAIMPDEHGVRETIKKFIGHLSQIPPMYSAKKIAGKKLYELAREGKTVERKPNIVTIHDITIASFTPPNLTFTVRCSSGTYIRTLAHDIGAALGIGAYLETLRRTKIGAYSINDAITLDKISRENWQQRLIPIDEIKK
jgi:tRNA pseudouridine55 synthase